MGCSTSRIEDEQVVILCKARKRFIKQAVEQRYALAAAHVAYIQALKSTGIALGHLAEEEMLLESSLPTSHTTTPEPVVLPEKSSSPFPSSSLSPPPSPPVEGIESPRPPESLASNDAISPVVNASPPGINYMRSGGTRAMTFEDRPPSPERATLRSCSTTPRSRTDQFAGASMPPTAPSSSQSQNPSLPPPPPSPSRSFSWDFFNPFTPLDDPYHFPEHRALSQTSEGDPEDLKLVREEEGIPELEDGEQGEERREEEKKEVHLQESTSEALSVDSEENYSEIANEEAVGTRAEKPLAVPRTDSFMEAPCKPSAEAMAHSITESIIKEIPARDINEASDGNAEKTVEEVEALAKDKDAVDEKTYSKKEDADMFVTRGARNLLAGMKDIEDQFVRASESGKEVARMLESNKVHYPSSFTETKGRLWASGIFSTCGLSCYRERTVLVSREPSSRVLNAITWHRSTSLQSSSSKAPLASKSKDDIDDSSSDFVEDFCMISGSHASTLERLYAWEKKLYDEVKAGECIRRAYEKKCIRLRHQEEKGEGSQVIDKTRAAIKNLHSRIRVAIQAVDSVSKRIQKLRDEELEPQIAELIQGLIRMWKVMLECHRTQYQIILEANPLGSSAVSGMPRESHRQATIQLENELHNWYSSFSNWISAQKAYVQALNGWLSKCIKPASEISSKGRMPPFSPRKAGAPTVVIIFSDWSHAFDQTLQEKEVVNAIRNLESEVRALWARQDEHQRQKTENFAKDVDKRVLSLEKVESRMHHNQHSTVEKQRSNTIRSGTSVANQKLSSDSFRNRVDEKVGHHKLMQQTHYSSLNSLHTGLKHVFESLMEFAEASLNTYQALHVDSEKAHLRCENGKISYI